MDLVRTRTSHKQSISVNFLNIKQAISSQRPGRIGPFLRLDGGSMFKFAKRVLASLNVQAEYYRSVKPRDSHWIERTENKRKGHYREGGEDLPEGVFTGSPSSIANALKSHSKDMQQALSRLSFYRNKSGDNIPSSEDSRLDQARDAIYRAYGETPPEPK